MGLKQTTMMHYNPDTNLIGSEPKKKIKKKPTGILKDLQELERYGIARLKSGEMVLVENKNGQCVEWSDVEAIIKKYSNP